MINSVWLIKGWRPLKTGFVWNIHEENDSPSLGVTSASSLTDCRWICGVCLCRWCNSFGWIKSIALLCYNKKFQVLWARKIIPAGISKWQESRPCFTPTGMLIFMCLVAACMDRNPHQPHHEGGGHQGLQWPGPRTQQGHRGGSGQHLHVCLFPGVGRSVCVSMFFLYF